MQREQRAAWRDQAEAQCLASRQVAQSSYVNFRSTSIEGPGACGMTQPLRVSAFAGGKIGLTSPATLACPIIPTTDRWLDEYVQKAAMNNLGAQVIEIKAGSYSCRAMNNGSGTSRKSEHAFGNAVDVFAFRLSDGREITVKSGWRGAPEEQAFLREAFLGACELYSTVLGPGADMFHYDHFHVDLARHGRGRSICKPRVDYTPNPNATPPLPDRTSWSSARAPLPPATTAGGASAMAMSRPDSAPPPGWMAGPQPAQRLQTAEAPSPGGPIRLPGSVALREEIVEGDIDGRGVFDRMETDPAAGDNLGGDLISPERDPFAVDAPVRR
ncbi:MAG: extensin [Comamonadaceae bacterium]|nr:extensin [Comamonadaceae bacterium]